MDPPPQLHALAIDSSKLIFQLIWLQNITSALDIPDSIYEDESQVRHIYYLGYKHGPTT